MENRKICKICDKSYVNGKALGGHMKSHFVKFPLPPKSPARSTSPVNSSATTRRRSDRHRAPSSPAPGISEEDAAQYLVDLSRDTWQQEREDSTCEKVREFTCVECDKRFGSYQALGGHMASHKRTREVEDDDDGDGVFATEEEEEEVVETASFRCEYCFRVFGSRRGLGGHKKVHFSTHLPKNVMSPSFGGSLVIDLFM